MARKDGKLNWHKGVMNDTAWTPGWRIRMIEDMYEDIAIESQE